MDTTPPNEGALALRIVVAGAAGAGKTSTVEALGEGLGQPAEARTFSLGGDVRHLDWMEYRGGRHEGKPIHTQLFSVSSAGAAETRTSLIQSGDVILFVVDSTPAGQADAEESLLELLHALSGMDLEAPQVIVQANKRDLPDADDVDNLKRALALDEGVAVIETIATDGDGVRQAFVYAVRSGLERAARLGDARPSAIPTTADELLTAQQGVKPEAEPEPELEPDEPEADEPEPEPEPEPDGAGFVIVDQDPTAERPASTPPPPTDAHRCEHQPPPPGQSTPKLSTSPT